MDIGEIEKKIAANIIPTKEEQAFYEAVMKAASTIAKKKSKAKKRDELYSERMNNALELLAKNESLSYQTRVLLILLRQTVGWLKKSDWISFGQFQGFTGIKDRANVNRTVKTLEKARVIHLKREGQNKSEYTILV